MELQTRSSFTREDAQAAELKQMWGAALREYDESRGHADSPNPSALSHHEEIDSCTSLEEYLEEKNKGFKSFRARKKKLFGALRAALQPVQAMGSIASGGASTVFAPSSSIFSAVTFLVQAAQNVTKKYDMIIAMFEEMQRFTDRLKVLVRHGAMDDDLRKEVVKTMAIILKFIGVVEKAIRDGRTVTFFKRAFTAEDPVQTVRDELDGSVQQVIRLVESLTYSEARLHHKDEDIARDRQEKRRKWAALEKRLDVNAAMPDILDEINNAKLENTCEWIRDDPSFIRWMSGSAPVLWVSGRMGTGKTHLAADLVRFLRSSSKTDVSSDAQLSEEECEIRTATYFCGKSTSRMDSSRRILDTLVYQLACQSGSFFDKAVRVYDVLGNQSSSRQLWEQLLRSVIHSDIQERYVVVIDGLDELEETELEDLLKQLEWLCLELGKHRSSAGSTIANLPVTIVALGRPSLDDYVGSHFEQDLETIDVLWEKSAEDLGAYIRNSTDRSRELYRLNLPTELREEIVKTLERGADGSFLWVKLKVQEISKQSQVSKIRAILETPPAQLGEQLEKTLYSLSGNDSDAETLNTILTFTTWFEGHIHLDELALVPKLESDSFEDEHGFVGLEDLLVTQNPSMTEDAFNEDYLPMAPASIRDAASWHLWRHYSNTSDWHTCLALTYYGMGYRWSTIWACQQAVVLDEAAWHAFYLLSLSHMDLGHGETALSSAENSLKFWPSELAWSKLHYRVIRHLADCKRACGDDEGAYSIMTDVLRERPTDLRAFRAYIEFIDDKETWNRDLELLSETIHALHGCRSSRYACSKASELLLDDLVCDGSLQSIIIRSLRAAGKSHVGIEIFVRAIEAAETIQKPQYVAALKIDLADLLYENKRSITHAVRCIRQSLNMDPTELSTGPVDDSHSLSLVQQMVRYRAIASLTRYTSARFLQGIEEGDYHAQTTAYNTLNHLWELGTNVNAYIPIWLWFQRHCWYHCFLGASKLHDTERFAEFWTRGLRTVIGMLARPPRVRGDTVNEGAGLPFRRLAYMFQISGRPQESLAALSVRVLLNSTVAALQDVGEDISFFDFICDGPCADKNEPWRAGRGLHRCQLCLDTDWCDGCMVRLGRGEIAYTLCSAAHPFLHIVPFKKPERGYVVRGNCAVKITDWIGELAEESGLSEFWDHFKGRIESAAVIGTAERSDSGSDFDSDTCVDSESDLDSEVDSDSGSQ
ncbi:hypothetical protein SLS64_013336 [Diaporthe eres]